MNAIQLQSVSMGKGIVHWRVVHPSLSRRNRNLKKQYADLDEACADLKRFLIADEVEARTRAMVEERAPAGEWGTEAGASASS
jgi:hypothetical protein